RWRGFTTDGTLGAGMSHRCCFVVAVVAFAGMSCVADARPRTPADTVEPLLNTVRDHRRRLEASIPRREEDQRAAKASLDRDSGLYRRGLITRAELAMAAREVSDARAQLESTKVEIFRATALAAEIEAWQRLTRLPSLRRGQYEASEGFMRFAGSRRF